MRGRRPSPSAKFGAERLLERQRGLLVDRLGLAQELLELGPDDVDVDRDAGVLEREQADPEGALDESGAVVGRSLGKERGERPVVDDEPVDDDPVGLDPDARSRAEASGPSRTVSGGQRFGGHGPRCGRP